MLSDTALVHLSDKFTRAPGPLGPFVTIAICVVRIDDVSKTYSVYNKCIENTMYFKPTQSHCTLHHVSIVCFYT